MTHIFQPLVSRYTIAAALTLSLFMQSCSEPADQFFGAAVLNTNTISDFGTPTLAKHIADQTLEFADIPSSKKKGDEAVTYVKNNLLYMEKSLKDIKELSANDDERKDIKAQSIALYELVIPVYKNEYTAYAKLCDTKASQEDKDQLVKTIGQKYNANFEQKYAALLASAKVFAEKNNLNVDWK
jgi:hypothetical protein